MSRPTSSGTPRDAYPPVPRPIASSPYISQTSPTGVAAMVGFCVVFWFTSLNRLNHTDLWGHLAYGRWIAETREIPDSDPFGGTSHRADSEGRFFNLPWLAQWSAYQVYRVGGQEGLVLIHSLLATVACGLLMLAIAVRGLPGWSAVGGGRLMYVIAMPSVGTLRPQLCGLVAFPLVLLAIGILSRARRHPLLWLPLVFVLWANCHGSFVLGLGALFLWTFSGWLEVRWFSDSAAIGESGLAVAGSSEGSDSVQSLLVDWRLFLLCTVACCLNPMGPRLLLQVVAFGGNPALEQIIEWGPLVLRSLGGGLFFVSLLVTIVLVRYSSRAFLFAEVMLLLAFGLFSLLSMRMLVWWAIVWPWVMMPHFLNCWQQRHVDADQNPVSPASQGTMRTLYALSCISVALCWSPPSSSLISGKPRGLREITSSDTPLYAADQMVWRELGGNTFCPLDWGDYLIWRTQGAIKPMVFSHVHLVQPQIWQDYLLLNQGDRSWLRLADKYELDFLILSRERNQTLVRDVQRLSRAAVIYQDEQSLIVRLLPAGD